MRLTKTGDEAVDEACDGHDAFPGSGCESQIAMGWISPGAFVQQIPDGASTGASAHSGASTGAADSRVPTQAAVR
jgi:hypothetical protein